MDRIFVLLHSSYREVRVFCTARGMIETILLQCQQYRVIHGVDWKLAEVVVGYDEQQHHLDTLCVTEERAIRQYKGEKLGEHPRPLRMDPQIKFGPPSPELIEQLDELLKPDYVKYLVLRWRQPGNLAELKRDDHIACLWLEGSRQTR